MFRSFTVYPNMREMNIFCRSAGPEGKSEMQAENSFFLIDNLIEEFARTWVRYICNFLLKDNSLQNYVVYF